MPKGMRVQVPPRAPNLSPLAELLPTPEKSTNPLLQRDSIPVSMARQRKSGDRPAKKSAAKKENGSTVCALCGRIMSSGSPTSQEPAIYSVCPSCKRMPYRNPGSAASLC